MKITEYPNVKKVKKDQKLLLDGGGIGTANVKTEDAFLSMAENIDPAIYHRNFYRGKNLGPAITDEQLAAIRDGSFDDLWVGDYWEDTEQNIEWMIADINYWSQLKEIDHGFEPHLVVISKEHVMSSRMNSTDTTNGGFYSTEIYGTVFNAVTEKAANFFGIDNMMRHRSSISNSVSNGKIMSIRAEYPYVDLLDEPSVFGCRSWTMRVMNLDIQSSSFSTYTPRQLSLFNLNQKSINFGIEYWLKDVGSAYGFFTINADGYIGAKNSSDNWVGIRPIFAVG